MQIHTNGHISLDSQDTGLSIMQHIAGSTIVFRATGKELRMPASRYSLSCDRPASGVAGRTDFERDLLQMKPKELRDTLAVLESALRVNP